MHRMSAFFYVLHQLGSHEVPYRTAPKVSVLGAAFAPAHAHAHAKYLQPRGDTEAVADGRMNGYLLLQHLYSPHPCGLRRK